MCLSMVLCCWCLRICRVWLVLIIRQLWQAVRVFPQRSNLILSQCRFQRPIEGVYLQCFVPAGLIGAQIGAPTGKLAGRIDQHGAVLGSNDANQRAFAVGPPASNASPLRNVSLSGCCLGHFISVVAEAKPIGLASLAASGACLGFILGALLGGLALCNCRFVVHA